MHQSLTYPPKVVASFLCFSASFLVQKADCSREREMGTEWSGAERGSEEKSRAHVTWLALVDAEMVHIKVQHLANVTIMEPCQIGRLTVGEPCHLARFQKLQFLEPCQMARFTNGEPSYLARFHNGDVCQMLHFNVYHFSIHQGQSSNVCSTLFFAPSLRPAPLRPHFSFPATICLLHQERCAKTKERGDHLWGVCERLVHVSNISSSPPRLVQGSNWQLLTVSASSCQ